MRPQAEGSARNTRDAFPGAAREGGHNVLPYMAPPPPFVVRADPVSAQAGYMAPQPPFVVGADLVSAQAGPFSPTYSSASLTAGRVFRPGYPDPHRLAQPRPQNLRRAGIAGRDLQISGAAHDGQQRRPFTLRGPHLGVGAAHSVDGPPSNGNDHIASRQVFLLDIGTQVPEMVDVKHLAQDSAVWLTLGPGDGI